MMNNGKETCLYMNNNDINWIKQILCLVQEIYTLGFQITFEKYTKHRLKNA